MVNRTVIIHPVHGEFIEIGRMTDFNKVWAAIGYLSTWGVAPEVHIYRDREYDLYAIYSHGVSAEIKPLVIGAVWNGIDYEFHM